MMQTSDGILSEFKQELRNRYSQAKRALPEESTGNAFMFFSFDLVNSTSFKTKYPQYWPCVITNFYNQVLSMAGVDNYQGIIDIPNTIKLKLWKLIGDEVLLCAQIGDIGSTGRELYDLIRLTDRIVKQVMGKVSQQCIDCEEDSCEIIKVDDLNEIVGKELGVKGAVWIAWCVPYAERVQNSQYKNIIYENKSSAEDWDRPSDFLGQDIDEGFRMSKLSTKNRTLISPLLAYTLFKMSGEDNDFRKIIKSNLKITAYQSMKGVWNGRKVPIILFSSQFERFANELEYDEIDGELYENIRKHGINIFLNERTCQIDYLEKIFFDVKKIQDANTLVENICTHRELIADSAARLDIHAACICFTIDHKAVVWVEKESNGWEAGCIHICGSRSSGNWKKDIESGYKTMYNLDVKVAENPLPVATYKLQKQYKNVLGIIFIGQIPYDSRSIPQIEKALEYKCLDFEDVDNLNGKMVSNFKENLKRAFELEHGMSREVVAIE